MLFFSRHFKQIITLLFLIIIYLFVLQLTQPQVFTYRFNPQLIDRYYLSQDIPVEVPGKRLFLSDGEIHISAGYLYLTGLSPAEINFQHPPLIKYLYGLTTVLWQNPYIAQVGLGLFLLLLTYIWAYQLTRKWPVAVLTCVLLLIDPLFLQLSGDALLDLGQSTLLLLYFLILIYQPKRSIWAGVALGLLITAKFWGGVGFLVGAAVLYQIIQRKINIKSLLTQLSTAFIVVSVVYLPVFWQNQGKFNLIFFQLKTIKYWLNHSVASIFGSSLILFLSGYFKTWWGNGEIIRSETWSVLWPIGIVLGLWSTTKDILRKNIKIQTISNSLPFLYLLFLGFQAPFIRYFILILPFMYTGIAVAVVSLLNQQNIRKKLFA